MDSKQKESLRSRQNSAAATPVPNPGPRSPVPANLDANLTNSKPKPHYTVFIRLPFQRNGFLDPPPVAWDAGKDEALWKLISGSTGKELNWEEISLRFQVSLPFLLQQAAWLYERRFESMKAQMKRLGVSGTASPNPQLMQGERVGSAPPGGESMVRTGSRGMSQRGDDRRSIANEYLDSQKSQKSQRPSAINTQRNSPLPAGDVLSSPGTPRSNRPLYSRTPSTTTVTQSRVFAASPRPPSQALAKGPDGSALRRTRPTQAFESLHSKIDQVGHSNDGTSESESEDEPAASSRSRAIGRAVAHKKPMVGSMGSDGDVDDDDEDDDSGGYLPFATGSKSLKADPAATLRNSPVKQATPPQPASMSKGKMKEQPPDSSNSSASSAQHPPSSYGNKNGNATADPSRQTAPPLSPHHRADLVKLSPRYRKSGSEGSPSMGSSFSDLDDASVTQSALDDAILSNMQHQSMGMTVGAGMGSRISGLRDALARK